jgi:Fur family ferric uptake transcriptional regulator
MQCKQHINEFKLFFRGQGLKATLGRLEILDVFAHQAKPISIGELKSKIGGSTNLVTLYRNVETLAKIGILNRIRLQDKKDYYEFAYKTHHHHLVCSECGKVSDVEACNIPTINPKILKQSGFAQIKNHRLEFFGLCVSCA